MKEENQVVINELNNEESKEKEINFEEAINGLEKIAEELEKDELDLEESVKKFEEGMLLSKKCNEILEKAEKKITILIDGEEKDFKPED